MREPKEQVNRSCVPRPPVGVVFRQVFFAALILSPPKTQVGRHVIGLDTVDARSTPADMPEKMPAVSRVLFDGEPAESVLAHVLAQHGQAEPQGKAGAVHALVELHDAKDIGATFGHGVLFGDGGDVPQAEGFHKGGND